MSWVSVINYLFHIGLGIYGDSNSESEEEQSEHVQAQNNDSDEELIVRCLESSTNMIYFIQWLYLP